VAAAGPAHCVSSTARGPDGQRQGGGVAFAIDLLDPSRPGHRRGRRLVPQDHRAVADGDRPVRQGARHGPLGAARPGHHRGAAHRLSRPPAFPAVPRSTRRTAQRPHRQACRGPRLGRWRGGRGTPGALARLSPPAGRHRRRGSCRAAAVARALPDAIAGAQAVAGLGRQFDRRVDPADRPHAPRTGDRAAGTGACRDLGRNPGRRPAAATRADPAGLPACAAGGR
jgi:hypothetical protein